MEILEIFHKPSTRKPEILRDVALVGRQWQGFNGVIIDVRRKAGKFIPKTFPNDLPTANEKQFLNAIAEMV